jgi:hypothetical protein
MKNKRIRLGSVIILFVLVSVILVILAVLGLSTARADLVVANRYRSNVTSQYEIMNQGTEWMADTEKNIMSGALRQDTVKKTITGGNKQLEIVLRVNPDKTCNVDKWKLTTVREESQGLNLFNPGD